MPDLNEAPSTRLPSRLYPGDLYISSIVVDNFARPMTARGVEGISRIRNGSGYATSSKAIEWGFEQEPLVLSSYTDTPGT